MFVASRKQQAVTKFDNITIYSYELHLYSVMLMNHA